MKRIASAKLLLALFLLAACLPASAVNITIRLGCDIAIPQAVAPGYNTGQSAYPLNLNTGGQPVFTRGDAIGFQLSFLNNGTLFNSTNFTNVVGVYLALNQSQFDTNAPMLLGYEPLSAFNTNLSRQAWLTGNNTQTTNQHVTIPFASSLTGVSLQGAASQQYWMSIYFTNTDGSTVTALAGPITVQDRPLNYLSPAPILNGVTVNGSNQITYPGASNFFQANSNALNSAVSALAGGVQVAPGANMTAQTNGNVVTLNSMGGATNLDGTVTVTGGTNVSAGPAIVTSELYASNAAFVASNAAVAAAVSIATNDAAAIATNVVQSNTLLLTNDTTMSLISNNGVLTASAAPLRTNTLFTGASNAATGLPLADTSVVSNLPLSAFNPQYFNKVGNTISFIAQNAAVDTRPLQDTDWKAGFYPTPTNGIMFVMMTNNGPCTIQSILVDTEDYPGHDPVGSDPIISIFADGKSNGCNLWMFMATAGNPQVPFHGQVIDFKGPSSGGNPSTAYGAIRQVFINARTNASVGITFYDPNPNPGGWFDVEWRSGLPTVTNSWHMLEKQQMTQPSNTFSITNFNAVGQVESLTMFALASNSQSYLEARPYLMLDGTTLTMNGTEDFFGSQSYFMNGMSVYATPQWGNESEYFLAKKYGFGHGNCSYRFLNNAYFNTTFSLVYSNTTSVAISNDFLLTYWTTP